MMSPNTLFPRDKDSMPLINDNFFTEDDLLQAIDELSRTSAPGPDGFPAPMLKKCSNSLVLPLKIIMRCSLDKGQIPENLKLAHVVPIHKEETGVLHEIHPLTQGLTLRF